MSPLLNKVVAFYMGESYEMSYLAARNMFIAEKVSYLPTCIVKKPSDFTYPETEWDLVLTFNAKLSCECCLF